MADSQTAAPSAPSETPAESSPQQPATTTAAPSEPAKPAEAKVDPSEAGRILRRARERAGIAPKEAAKAEGPKAAAPESKPGSTDGQDPKAPAASTEPPKTEPPKPSPDDEAAEKLSQIVKASRKLHQEREAFEAAKKADETSFTAGKLAIDARGKGEHLAALDALGYKTEQDLSDILMALVGRLKEPEAITPETVEALVKKGVSDTLAQQAKTTQDAKVAQDVKAMDEASAAMGNALHVELTANLDKYPLVKARGVSLGWENRQPVGDVDKFIVAEVHRTGEMPSPTRILEHFQAKYEAEATAAGYSRAPKAPAAPPATATATTDAWKRDSGAAAPSKEPALTLEQKSEAIKQRLRAMRASA